MVDLSSLLRALPISGLEPQPLAYIRGLATKAPDEFIEPAIELLEPPAGHRVSFVDPQRAMEILFRHLGESLDAARSRADAEWARLRSQLASSDRAVFLDTFEPDTPDCIPAASLIAHLRAQPWVDAPLLDFLERAIDATIHAPMFEGPDQREQLWPLAEHPAWPPPKAMIEFMPGAPWEEYGDDFGPQARRFSGWREGMRGIAADLKAALGEPVYHFAAPDCDYDDDNPHRFLVLHWCCTARPRSRYVDYLVEASGARDVEELKAALIDPASYAHPFRMNDAFVGIESKPLRIEYLPQDRGKVVAVVFRTPQAQPSVQRLLLQSIDARPWIVAPPELLQDAWLNATTRNCHEHRVLQYLHHDDDPADPIALLAQIDELHVVADSWTAGHGHDLQLREPVENLLWLALQVGLPASCHSVQGWRLSNPEVSLKARGVPQRVAALQARSADFQRSLGEIRLACDGESSGLWNDRDRMLDYDDLALPFPLVRRIAAWQRDYNDTFMRPDAPSMAEWWQRHDEEELALAAELQQAVGPGTCVKVWRDKRWRPISELKAAGGKDDDATP